MDVTELLDGLNDKQREAVSAPKKNLLILAGAGSGKTRVLVHRIAWLLAVERLSSHNILAVTFTNKAAKEMQYRISALIGNAEQGMWIGTFHGLAHRLLRTHAIEAKLPKTFQVIDSDDQIRMVKRILKAMNIDEKQWPAKQGVWYINNKKDEGLRPSEIETYNNPIEQQWKQIYTAYQESCDRAGLVDFAELLIRSYELWKNNPALLRHYQSRFNQILVDEFQDTNHIQYAWIKLLATGKTDKPDEPTHSNVMIVGDDDQSIYGWRGAQIENIRRFTRDYFEAVVIRLEQNYRSTHPILTAANTLIANNSDRMGKNLWTDNEKGELISVYSAFNELDEARFVVEKIKRWKESGKALAQVAVLYRNNSQSRVIEEAMLQGNVPYRIYGGMRFFDRQEIKDALAYLRLLANRDDDAAFERVINTPTRGMGERTLDTLRQYARSESKTLWQSVLEILENKSLSGRSAGAMQRFIELIEALDKETMHLPLHLQTEYVIKHSGLFEYYKQEQGEKAQARIDNLEELVNAAKEYVVLNEELEMTPLQSFLSHASLEAGEGQADAHQDAAQMMTLHSAKGLEFEQVFMVGMEEGMFPSQMSAGETSRLEEERRLAYVGITRARQKLTLSFTESRRLYGQEVRHRPSRFIGELPENLLEEVRLRGAITTPASNSSSSSHKIASQLRESDYSLGQRVKHHKFGEGTIINIEGEGEHTRLQIAFQGQGIKWLVASYAKLTT
ncbi:DNA helicase II [Thorsellia anophelis]|uniref:DNA 3'-5' helicase n=1 Tax=Thorsellia anophelis DSM 18579 TaxID=1123402 RepID=A0A1H9ZZI9_9GAMM|nr:DNA helicase II [Thorsellia anophelis]SES86796.1 ATP-dependent DNA helicase UvrD [Thorsellia anophelis DSM 18579]